MMKYIVITLLFICCMTSLSFADSLDVSTHSDSTLQLDAVASSSNSIYPMSFERKEKLVAYSQFKNVWRFVDFFISLGILLLILFTGLSAKLRTYANNITNKFFALWAFVILFFTIEYIMSLPFHIYRSFLVEGEFGFVNQSFIEWFSEDLLSLGITMLIGIIPIFFIYWLINKTKFWWLQFALGSIPFIIVMMIVAPIFIAPMFNKFIELENKELKSEIHTLAEQVGIEGADIFQVNTSKQSSKINAYVTGIFNSKRIVLTDNLINNFTTNEIKFVMGHEMGHYVQNHIWKGLFVAIIIIALALWITGLTIQKFIDKYKERLQFDSLSDCASLPLLLIYLSLIMFMFNPISNSMSRYHEHQSDIYGMDVTDVTGEEAATAFDKLSVYNLADPDPHPFMVFWFYSHPSLKDRIEFVRNYRN